MALSEQEIDAFAARVHPAALGRLCTAVEQIVARHVAAALDEAAQMFRTDAAEAWGGLRGWYTNGSHVAELVADWIDEFAADRRNEATD